MKAKYLIIVVLFVITYIISAELIFLKREKELNESHIRGIIEYLYSSRDGIKFRIENDPKGYRFYPKSCKQSEKYFYDIAEIGDSVIKPSFSDTLILIKNKKKYLYTFK